MTRTKKKDTLIIAFTSLALASSASATITVVEHQTFNDNATPASYTEVGTPTYSGGSLILDGSSGLTFTGTTPLTATDNFGIEAIVTASSFDTFDFVITNSVGTGNLGYGLVHVGGWKAIVMGIQTSSGSAAAVDTEYRLAYVRDEGFGALYVNGSFAASINNTPAAPTQVPRNPQVKPFFLFG